MQIASHSAKAQTWEKTRSSSSQRCGASAPSACSASPVFCSFCTAASTRKNRRLCFPLPAGRRTNKSGSEKSAKTLVKIRYRFSKKHSAARLFLPRSAFSVFERSVKTLLTSRRSGILSLSFFSLLIASSKVNTLGGSFFLFSVFMQPQENKRQRADRAKSSSDAPYLSLIAALRGAIS